MQRAHWLGVMVAGLVGLSSAPALAQEAPAAAPAVETPVVATPAPAEPPPPSVAAAPQAAPSTAPGTPVGSVKLHVRANQPGVAFHYAKMAFEYSKRTRANEEVAPREWTRLCLEECDVSLPPGGYRLALSYGAANPVMAPSTLQIASDTKLEGAYTDRSQRRLAGWLVLGIGGVASASSIALGAGIAGQVSGGEELGSATLISGVVGLALSLAVGIPLAASGDRARVDLRQ